MCSAPESKMAQIASRRSPSMREVAHPALGALGHPLPHRVALGVVVVDRAAPRRLVLLGEVRTEGVERRSTRGAHVVVDHVEDHGQSRLVRRAHQLRQLVRSAVGGLRGRQVNTVVSPPVPPGELGHGHDLDRRHAELGQRRELTRGGRERALGRERPDVKLVDHMLIERERIAQRRRRSHVQHPRGTAQPFGLPARAGIGIRIAAVEHEPVVLTGARLHHRLVYPVAGVFERDLALAHPDRHRLGPRRPHAELGAAVSGRPRPQCSLPRILGRRTHTRPALTHRARARCRRGGAA